MQILFHYENKLEETLISCHQLWTLKSQLTCSPNILPFPQEWVSFWFNCTNSQINVLRSSQWGCMKALRKKLKFSFNLSFVFLLPQTCLKRILLFYWQKKMKKEQTPEIGRNKAYNKSVYIFLYPNPAIALRIISAFPNSWLLRIFCMFRIFFKTRTLEAQ